MCGVYVDILYNYLNFNCITAFAELQTDMTDLTTDLQTSGIPTLDQKSYVMKVFFPGVIDHPVLLDTKVCLSYPQHSRYIYFISNVYDFKRNLIMFCSDKE